ncbi:MAG: glycosyltransferase involved in cell wall biosynthesis [Verrucomicrobiales bacterium]|jgi:glycosyltransferase involved in cell wall biosynthesis
MPRNIGFISTRFAGTDGVSLEAAKWAEIFEKMGHRCFWLSGRSDRDPAMAHCVPEAHFEHPENRWINEHLWGRPRRPRFVSERVRDSADYLKSAIYRFVDYFDIDILVPQNAITIPMHVPLGLAITEFLGETRMPAIAHHHDFYWERTRFSNSAARDYLDMAFPPSQPNIFHAVINRPAQQALSLRKGVSSTLVPNVFNFEEPPPEPDEFSSDVRKELGLAEDDIFILQPTRLVPRKGIEHAIKLVGALKNPRCKLVVSHDAGDEGFEYKNLLAELAEEEGVEILFVSDRVGEVRQFDAQGRKIYTLWDLYPHADLVTYPSTYEGFGNALLEAIYFRKPVVVNRYSIFIEDIEPKGFQFAVMDGFVSRQVVREVRRILADAEYREEMVKHNYRVAAKHYGYTFLVEALLSLLYRVGQMELENSPT